MKYNISKINPPAMPSLGKGTECVMLLLSQVSKDMQQPIVPLLFPILGAHLSGAEFMYPDQSWKEKVRNIDKLPQNCQMVHTTRGATHHRTLGRAIKKEKEGKSYQIARNVR